MESLVCRQCIYHHIIPEGIFEVIKPIYVRLIEKSLLQKCLTGATQSAHESFQGIVWQHCPENGNATWCTITRVVLVGTPVGCLLAYNSG